MPIASPAWSQPWRDQRCLTPTVWRSASLQEPVDRVPVEVVGLLTGRWKLVGAGEPLEQPGTVKDEQGVPGGRAEA